MTPRRNHTRPARVTGRASLLLTTALLLFGAIPATPSAGQDDDQDWLDDCEDRADRRDDRYTLCDVRVERISARGTIRIDARPNGGVIVRGENRGDVEVHARIQTNARTSSAARSLLDEIAIDVGGATIRADGPSTGDGEWWSVTFVVYVPNRSDLDLVGHNGPVGVRDIDGRIEARTQNGPLSLRGVSGDVVARTQNGPLDIELDGRSWQGGGLDAETHNGPVHLAIPDGYSARLQTGTVNGPLTTDVPLTVTFLGRRNQRIDTTLGDGGPTIRAVTTNGPVVIRRR